MSAALEQLASLIRRETGISLKPGQLPSLAAALRRVDPAMDAAGFLSAQRATRATDGAARSPDRRGDRQRDLLLPPAPRARRDRLAAAARGAPARPDPTACASGWRPAPRARRPTRWRYSPARRSRPPPPPVSILGTDISAGDARARSERASTAGERCARSTREMRERYFVPVDGGVAVGDAAARAWSSSGATTSCSTRAPIIGGRDVRPDRLPQRADLLRRRVGRAGDRVARARRWRRHGDARARRRRPAVRIRAPARAARRVGGGTPAATAPAPGRALRRPLGRDPAQCRPDPGAPDAGLAAALNAAERGRPRSGRWPSPSACCDENPLDADAYFVRGLAELGIGDAEAAVAR